MIYQLAGTVPCDPDPLTFRELVDLADGAQRDRWGRHAALMALIANCHRNPDKRSQPFQPADFNPFHQRDRLERHVDEEDADIHVLKQIFVDRRPSG